MAAARKRGGDVSWSDLPPDLLRLITVFLTSVWDFVRFSAICPSWRSAADAADRPPRFPSLLLPYDCDTTVRSFLDPTDRRVHTIHIPEAQGKWIYCTPHGWLVMLGDDGLLFTVSILNPITRAHILLPPLPGETTNSRDWEKRKEWGLLSGNDPRPSHAVLSGNPSLSQSGKGIFLAFMFGQSRLHVCRLGDGEIWRMINLGIPSDPSRYMLDLAYFDGDFYAVDNYKGITIYKTRTYSKRYNTPAFWKSIASDNTLHLVESSGDLLLLERQKRYESVPSAKVIVFKLDRSNSRKLNWVRIQDSIGNMTLFLSTHHTSVSISSRDFSGCSKDQICFADTDFNSSKVNVCISNLVHGSITLDKPNYEDSSGGCLWNKHLSDRGLTWIVPSLN